MDRTRIRDEGTFGLAAWTGQSRGMVSAHRHLDLEINFLLSGTMRYLVGGGMVSLPPHRLCLLWGGVPHQLLNTREAADIIWITVPLAAVLRWGLPDGLIRPLLAMGFVADTAPRAGDFGLLHQWLDDLPRHKAGRSERGGNGPVCGIVLLEIEARLRRFALGLSRPPAEGDAETILPAAHHDRGLAAVEAMAQFVSQNFSRAIGVAEIAAPAHLHPNYAMTVFRQHTGMTLSQYLTLQRVAHAQRLLATTTDSIYAIAVESGFGSVSRFYEAFKQQTGTSPRKFRLHLEPSP